MLTVVLLWYHAPSVPCAVLEPVCSLLTGTCEEMSVVCPCYWESGSTALLGLVVCVEQPCCSVCTHRVPHAKMEDHDDLRARLKEVSDRISFSRNSEAAEAHRTASSSIGAETPMGVLAEIREGQSRLLDEVKTLIKVHQEVELRAQERHREMCTVLLGIAESSSNGLRTIRHTSSVALRGSEEETRSGSFYGSHSITNGTYLIACILMHMDNMLQSHPKFRKIQSTDSTFLDVKDWYNLCSSALSADKQSKVGLRIPKPTDEDFRNAARMTASPVRGRRPTCDATHLSLLLSSCPAIITTVEWMRSTLLKCTGVLSPERTCRFRLFKHPFVSGASELLVQDAMVLKLPNRWMHQDVLNMKATAKKEYMRLILEESIKPVDAISMTKAKP